MWIISFQKKKNATKILSVDIPNCQISKKKTPPKFCQLISLIAKFQKKNATKILLERWLFCSFCLGMFEKNATKLLSVKIPKCQIKKKKNATKILSIKIPNCQIWKKKKHATKILLEKWFFVVFARECLKTRQQNLVSWDP